jgi:GxxExxY protein
MQDPQTFNIIGAAMDVHKELGYGFLEAVYQEALAIEFTKRNIPHSKEQQIPIFYRGNKLVTSYRTDFLCYDSVVVELKAIKAISSIEEAQVINYLKATRLNRAIILNFGTPRMEYRRIVHNLPE